MTQETLKAICYCGHEEKEHVLATKTGYALQQLCLECCKQGVVDPWKRRMIWHMFHVPEHAMSAEAILGRLQQLRAERQPIATPEHKCIHRMRQVSEAYDCHQCGQNCQGLWAMCVP